VTVASARLGGIVRRFGSTVALDGAALELWPGEVHGVLGENGAGKSTLLGILGGMLRPDEGVVEIGGGAADLRSPREAWARGVALVHQHFTLVPTLSVIENLTLGHRERGGGWRLSLEGVRTAARALIDRTGLVVPLDVPVEALGVGERQRVEILKALLRDPPILALDEPTAVLTPAEVGSLFALLRELAAAGRAVVLVAHKIDEVLGVANRVTVLREGRTVLTAARVDVDAPSLVRAMVGGDLGDGAAVGIVQPAERPRVDPGEVVASLDGVRVVAAGRVALDAVSLSVRRGEVVGIAGVEGNGQRELALVASGRLSPEAGSVRVPEGVGFVPQDRSREGLVGDFDLVENVALALHADDAYRKGPFLDWAAISSRAGELCARFAVKASGLEARASALSGGNQQRLVVGRELGRATDLLVAENPSRGLDVAATAFVHEELVRLSRAPHGPGILLVSTDLDEVLALSDRILVLTRGRLIVVGAERRTREGVGELMLRGSVAEA
jgi:ABC-type uncharacterized transport system ATPase subunit